MSTSSFIIVGFFKKTFQWFSDSDRVGNFGISIKNTCTSSSVATTIRFFLLLCQLFQNLKYTRIIPLQVIHIRIWRKNLSSFKVSLNTDLPKQWKHLLQEVFWYKEKTLVRTRQILKNKSFHENVVRLSLGSTSSTPYEIVVVQQKVYWKFSWHV